MPTPPTRRELLAWLSASAAVGCAPDSALLPSKSTYAGGDTGGSVPGGPLGGGFGTDSAVDTGTLDDTAIPGDTGAIEDTGPARSAWECEQGTAPNDGVCAPSAPQGEGPFYLEDVPDGAEMNRRGADGIPLTVDLRVLDAACQPAAGVVVDLWHADETEAYDMTADHHCRGRLTTGADGTVCFTTLRPPPYGDGMGTFLPAHLHLNLLIDDLKVLTTQLYFTDCPYLGSMPPDLICTPQVDADGSQRIQVDLILNRIV